jgi:hypothetical protein
VEEGEREGKKQGKRAPGTGEREGRPGEKKRKGARIRESREEGQMEFRKGLYAISENCKGLFVKHNFSSI